MLSRSLWASDRGAEGDAAEGETWAHGQCRETAEGRARPQETATGNWWALYRMMLTFVFTLLEDRWAFYSYYDLVTRLVAHYSHVFPSLFGLHPAFSVLPPSLPHQIPWTSVAKISSSITTPSLTTRNSCRRLWIRWRPRGQGSTREADWRESSENFKIPSTRRWGTVTVYTDTH